MAALRELRAAGRVLARGPSAGRTRPSLEGDIIRAGGFEATFVADANDGIYFPQIRYVFEATNADTWDGGRARINSAVRCRDGYLGFYDEGRTGYDTYEEWCGIAWLPGGALGLLLREWTQARAARLPRTTLSAAPEAACGSPST